MPLGQPPQDDQQFDVLVRPSVPVDGDPAREPQKKLFEPGDDPKGWDRASIRLNTHPLHPRRRMTQEDFLLPRGGNIVKHGSAALKVLGDAVVFGSVLAALSYFPLWAADILVASNLEGWILGVMTAVALGGMSLVFLAAWADRHAEPY
jgi:hypothetical protein